MQVISISSVAWKGLDLVRRGKSAKLYLVLYSQKCETLYKAVSLIHHGREGRQLSSLTGSYQQYAERLEAEGYIKKEKDGYIATPKPIIDLIKESETLSPHEEEIIETLLSSKTFRELVDVQFEPFATIAQEMLRDKKFLKILRENGWENTKKSHINRRLDELKRKEMGEKAVQRQRISAFFDEESNGRRSLRDVNSISEILSVIQNQILLKKFIERNISDRGHSISFSVRISEILPKIIGAENEQYKYRMVCSGAVIDKIFQLPGRVEDMLFSISHEGNHSDFRKLLATLMEKEDLLKNELKSMRG